MKLNLLKAISLFLIITILWGNIMNVVVKHICFDDDKVVMLCEQESDKSCCCANESLSINNINNSTVFTENDEECCESLHAFFPIINYGSLNQNITEKLIHFDFFVLSMIYNFFECSFDVDIRSFSQLDDLNFFTFTKGFIQVFCLLI